MNDEAIYVNKSSGDPVSRIQIVMDNKGFSVPQNPTDDQLETLGYARINPVTPPTGDIVTEGPPEQHEDGTWHQTWIARDFTPAERAEHLADLRARKLREINIAYQDEMNLILSSFPWAETLTFDRQEREARAWQADPASPTPYIDTMLSERPIDKHSLIGKIIAKADQYASLSGTATGKRHRLEDEIDAAHDAGDLAALEGISWSSPSGS